MRIAELDAQVASTKLEVSRTDADQIRALRAQEVPWRAIANQLGIGTGTAIRAFQNGGAA